MGSGMHIQPVDPRDSRWQDDNPIFRVTFWTVHDDARGQPAYASAEYQITGEGVDVREVLSWAREMGNGSSATVIYVLVRDADDQPGLVRISGHEPNDYHF